MKKLLALLSLLGTFSLSPFAFADVAPEPDVFTDVQDGDEAYWEIRWMKEEGLVSGYEDGSYKPNNTINRAEFSKIVAIEMSAGTITGTDGGEIFTDIDYSSWYNPYVQYLYGAGVISGYPDNTFRPGNDVNYAEACKMISLAQGLEVSTSTGEWYEPYVKWVEDMGGKPESIESYDQAITRAEMAIMIYGVANNL